MTKKNRKLPDLAGLDRNELTFLLNELVDQHQLVELKISSAKSLAKTEGIYMDTQRFHNLNYAKLKINSNIRRVEQELRKRKAARGYKTLGDFFMELAHGLLKEETFEMILAEAKENERAFRLSDA